MVLPNATITIDGKTLGEPTNVWIDGDATQIGTVRDVVLQSHIVDCSVEFNEEGWNYLRKAMSRVLILPVPRPMEAAKKGRPCSVTIGDRLVVCTLYHIRKPRRDSEERIYYIREEFAGIPSTA